MLERLDLRRRARAAGVHLLISAAVALAAAALVFGLWYPGIYRLASGGRDLFLLVTGVDVILGPLLTFAVFNLAKGWRHLRRDLAVIGVIQTAALCYGLHTVYVVRPVAMVFEVDRFRVIAAGDVYLPELPKARPEYRTLPLTGPWLLGTRVPKTGEEHTDAIFMGLQGIDRANRPAFWQPYADSMQEAWTRSRTVGALVSYYPSRADEFHAGLAEMNADETTARFLPLAARGDWVIVLDAQGRVLGHLNADGFF
ncbi:MAG: TfpX/TfpZ family type IV pilin accessory protein [Burkholderiales bacterium]